MNAAMEQAVTEEARRQAWLAEAATVVTGTDLASVIQLDDAYKSLADLVLEKRGLLAKDASVPEYLEAGLRFQDANLRWYADKVKQPITFADPYQRVRCPRLPILAVSLDARWAAGDRRPVDAKQIGIKDAAWGEPGTDEVPPRYAAQMMAQMLCTETQVSDLSVVFGGRQHRIYTIPFDPQAGEALLDIAADFHRRYVAGDELPPVDASEGWTKLFNARDQRYADYLQADEAVMEWVEVLRAAQSLSDQAEADIALAKNHIRAFVGEHAGLITPYGKVHYKRNKDGSSFDAEAYAAALEEKLRALDPGVGEVLSGVRASFTSTKPGNRPLTPKFKE